MKPMLSAGRALLDGSHRRPGCWHARGVRAPVMNHLENLARHRTLRRRFAALWRSRCVAADRFRVTTALVKSSSGLQTPIAEPPAVERLRDAAAAVGWIGLAADHQRRPHKLADPSAGAFRKQTSAPLATIQHRWCQPTGAMTTRPRRPEPDAELAYGCLTGAASVRARGNASPAEGFGS